MKLIIFALVMAVALANNVHTGYLNKFEDSIAQAQSESYSLSSFTDLLRNNFQVIQNSQASELIQEFGKGNLLNPIQMNYLFVVEGKDALQNNNNNKINQAKILIEKSGEKLLDSIFSTLQEESLVRLTTTSYPKEKRVPFYYYKSQNIEEETEYEKDFGIELQRNAASGEYSILDNRSKKTVGKSSFSLQKCIKDNFAYASDYKFTKQGIYKKSDTSMALEINEQNARDVETLYQDLCAVSRLSNMFRQSQSPNFISFVLSYKSIEDNALVQELVQRMIENAGNNFSKNIGSKKTYGQTIFVENLEDVQSERVFGKIQPRLLSANFVALDDDGDSTNQNIGMQQIQFWFSIVFVIVLFVISHSLLNMKIGKDTLLYAKFIAADVK